MGLLSGALTFKIYKVDEKLPDDYIDLLSVGVKKYHFRQFANESRETVSKGWINPINPLEEIHDIEKLIVDEYLALGFRIDRKSVNKRLLKAHVDKRLAEIKKEKKIVRVSKGDKDAIVEEIRIKLLKLASPVTTIIEVAYNLNKNIIYFGSLAKSRNDDFIELFMESFGLNLSMVEPYTVVRSNSQKVGENFLQKYLACKSAIFYSVSGKNISEE